MKQVTGTRNFSWVWGSHLELLTSGGLRPPNGVYPFHRYHYFAVKRFLYRLCAGYRKAAVWALAPPMLKKINDSKVRFPESYGLATEVVEIRCI